MSAALGADVVIHSTSKALNGNGNSVGGIVVSGGRFKWNPVRFPKFRDFQFGPMSFSVRLRMRMVTDYGGCMAPFNAYLTGIGLDTLALRLDRACTNALELARFLQAQGLAVNYPGLADSPWHETAAKQFGNHFGTLLTVRLGTKEKAYRFINALNYALNVSNIGDARTLVVHPASTIFAHASEDEKQYAGVTDDLVRISTGLEDIEDLLEDYDITAVGEKLNQFGIAVRAGHHCAQPVLRHFGLEGTVRPTLAFYNSPEDIDALVRALRSF